MKKLYKPKPFDDFDWKEVPNTATAPKYRYYDDREFGAGVQPVPWITTTTKTTPIHHEAFIVTSPDDSRSELVYNYLVERKSSVPFTMESIKIELLGVISIQKGELLSILIQMVNDGILSFSRKTATYTFNQ